MTKRQILITICAGMIVCGVVLAGNYYINNSTVNINDEQEQASGMLGAGSVLPTPWFDQSGLVTYMMGGQFDSSVRGTSTIIAFLDPFFSATNTNFLDAGNVSYLKANTWHGTSTVDLAVINYFGTATSSWNVECGASADITDKPTYDIIDTSGHGGKLSDADAAIATTTPEFLISGIAYDKGLKVIQTGTTTAITLNNQYPFITCSVTSTSGNWPTYGGAFTEPTSLLDGTFQFRILRSQH